jgi:hypothetical protein
MNGLYVMLRGRFDGYDDRCHSGVPSRGLFAWEGGVFCRNTGGDLPRSNRSRGPGAAGARLPVMLTLRPATRARRRYVRVMCLPIGRASRGR